MTSSFLLVSDRGKSAWSAMLGQTLAPLGSLRVVTKSESLEEILRRRHDLIIIDAAAVEQPAELVAHLCGRCLRLRILVIAITPTWQECRAVLRAGAIDYVPRPVSQEESLLKIKEALNVPIPVAID